MADGIEVAQGQDIQGTGGVKDRLAALMKQRGGQPASQALARPVASMAGARAGQIGGLRGETIITIQTRQAQRLLTGVEATDGRHGITGLMKFSGYLAQITAMAAQDDPWADWVLVRVEALLRAAESGLGELNGTILQALAVNPLMEITVSHSTEPLKVNVGFAAKHAYWVARVIVKFDEVVRGVLTLRHQALLTQKDGDKLLDQAAAMVRRVFEATVDYRATGVTRDDVAAKNALAQQAAQTLSRLGKVPDDVMAGTRRAEYAPPLPRKDRVHVAGTAGAVGKDAAAIGDVAPVAGEAKAQEAGAAQGRF